MASSRYEGWVTQIAPRAQGARARPDVERLAFSFTSTIEQTETVQTLLFNTSITANRNENRRKTKNDAMTAGRWARATTRHEPMNNASPINIISTPWPFAGVDHPKQEVTRRFVDNRGRLGDSHGSHGDNGRAGQQGES